jgi:hypothetical protein
VFHVKHPVGLGVDLDADGDLVITAYDPAGAAVVSAPLCEMVEEWIADSQVDGTLHPWVDGTLEVLLRLTAAQSRIVAHFAANDPHRKDFELIFGIARGQLERLLGILEVPHD